MKYYLYIDESGSFDEGLVGGKASVVGGVCSEFASDEWNNHHRAHLEQFHRSHPLPRFSFPGHYHCGPLLSGSLAAPKSSTQGDIRTFTDEVFQNILSVATFSFLSRNAGQRFEYSPQSTYVMNLIAALRGAFELLSESKGFAVEQVSVVVAQRTIGETLNRTTSVRQYMPLLLEHVSKQLLVGNGTGVALANRLHSRGQLRLLSGKGDSDAGLIAADFVCCLGRYGHKSTSGGVIHIWRPNPETLLGDYKAFHERQANELLKNKYYASCLEFVCRYFPMNDGLPDVEPLVRELDIETDANVLERELPAMLSVVHQLTRSRTNGPNLLVAATKVLNRLIAISEGQTSQNTVDETQVLWINFHVQALAELTACLNHSGAVGPQQVVQARLEAMLAKHKRSAGLDAPQRETLLLEVRNRNLNLLFNDYRFEEAYYLAEELADKRRGVVPSGDPDELLGQILGSQGQACAFMARSDPTMADLAKNLFQESLTHFSPGSVHEAKSRNYLVTTAWQSGRLEDAVGLMNSTQTQGVSSDNVIELVTARLNEAEQQRRAFDIVNYLRIASLASDSSNLRLDISIRTNLEQIARKIGTDHPYEQWLKWLGILHLQEKAYDKAESCFASAMEICAKYDFTMQTIGNSIALLLLISSRLRGLAANALTNERRFRSDLTKLRAQSIAFDAYIRTTQLVEILDKPSKGWVSDKQLKWSLYTYLPFAYA